MRIFFFCVQKYIIIHHIERIPKCRIIFKTIYFSKLSTYLLLRYFHQFFIFHWQWLNRCFKTHHLCARSNDSKWASKITSKSIFDEFLFLVLALWYKIHEHANILGILLVVYHSPRDSPKFFFMFFVTKSYNILHETYWEYYLIIMRKSKFNLPTPHKFPLFMYGTPLDIMSDIAAPLLAILPPLRHFCW